MWTPPPESAEASALSAIASCASGPSLDPSFRVTINFHPDRKAGDSWLLQVLAKDGVLRSQFETRTSNGGLTAFEGGARWNWESRIFSGAYDIELPSRRPKYGALNHRRRSVGGSPRFGSSHFRLASHVLNRTTFCYPDSFFEPIHFGNASHMGLIDACESDHCDELDRYIEAHVHGPVRLSRDVEALVLDECYHGTAVALDAMKLPVHVEWHSGFRVSLDTIHQYPDYRGPSILRLADSLAVDGWLTPEIIGMAAASGSYAYDDLKKVWHYVARFAVTD
ncbi:MAG: DUF3626 domain-containing protein [Planctomycetaceae bacterium]|nr:DUF3626 domain-containing protein [Planctomycetaceae bacterium]